MAEILKLKAKKRDVFGKKLAQFRKTGNLPAVLYGPALREKNLALFVPLAAFKKIWKEMGESAVIELEVDGSKKQALIHEVDVDPLSSEPRHVDFYAAQMDEPIQTSVPLVFEGISPAVKNLGGILVRVMHEIEIEALPKDLPHELTANLSKLENFEDKILAKDILLTKGVSLITNPEEVVALVEAPREEAPPPEEKIAFEEIEVVGRKEKEGKEEEETEKKEEKI